MLHPTVAALEEAQRNRYNQVTYGRHGTPTTFALEEAVAAVEGGASRGRLLLGRGGLLRRDPRPSSRPATMCW